MCLEFNFTYAVQISLESDRSINKKSCPQKGSVLLRGLAILINCLIFEYFQFFFFILKMKQYVCRNFRENFRQIGEKMKL